MMAGSLRPLTLSSFPSTLNHGFFTRRGGESTGLFQTLNLGLSKGDCPKAVIKNRERIANFFNQPLPSLCFAKQVHGNKALFIETPYDLDNPPQGDALITNIPGLIMGVQTADCVPVLLHDSEIPLVGALHGGWKGALSGIVENTIDMMVKQGAKRKTITANIGPCITQDSYEVDRKFYDRFLKKNKRWTCFFNEGQQGGKYFFDLRGFIHHTLREAGVQTIHTLNQNTYSNEALFFSCRRAFHKGEKTFGNQASCIMIQPP